MKPFILKIFKLFVPFFAFNMAISALGLFLMYKNNRYPIPPSVIIQKSRDTNVANKTLIIGCSNLQHNIDKKAVQQCFNNIDFLYFSGNMNSSFLEYLVQKGYTKSYKNVILYLPYHLFAKSLVLTKDRYSLEVYFSFDYVWNFINQNSFYFFLDNWAESEYLIYRQRYDTGHILSTFFYWLKWEISAIKQPSLSLSKKNFVINYDNYVEGINKENTSYTKCNEPFIHQNHITTIPAYTERDINFVSSLKLKNQNVLILFTPIPNIKENTTSLNNQEKSIQKLPNCLSKPIIMDSTFFYNQWYHLNKCGQEIETKRIINVLRSLK